MDVRLVGTGPAAEAVRAALADVDVSVVEGDPSSLTDADFGVVTAVTGAATLDRANEAAREGETPWLAVEVGGLGGQALVDVEVGVAGFGPSVGCYDCLRTRVAAALDEDAAEEPQASRRAVRLAGAYAGHEAVALLSGEESTLLGGVVEVPHARRRFLPVPGCRCDPGRDRGIERRHEATDVETALARAEQALDDRVGPVETVGELESFPVPYYLATLADTTGFSDGAAPDKAAGVAADWNPAFMKALGEALERYAAAVYRTTDLRQAPPSLLDDAVSPREFVRPADAPPVAADEPIRWVRGENLHTGESVHLPAEVVHFPPPEERYTSAITTGLGLGTSPVGALLAGLTEVIERDATMLSWYSTFDPLELVVEDETFRTLARRARSEDLAVTPLLVTVDVDVPVVAVAVHRDGDWPRFAVGSSAALSVTSAAVGALEEALQNWVELRSMGPERSAQDASAIGKYADFPGTARSFVDAGGPIPADSVGPSDPPTGTDALDALLERLAAADLTAYAADLTPRDLAAVDLSAVRVVVPGAQPLFTGDPFFGERARTVPAELGEEPRLDAAHHPYP